MKIELNDNEIRLISIALKNLKKLATNPSEGLIILDHKFKTLTGEEK